MRPIGCRQSYAPEEPAAAAGIAAWGLHGWAAGLDLGDLGHTIAAAIHVFVPLAAAVASFLLVAMILRMKEPGWLLTRRHPTASS